MSANVTVPAWAQRLAELRRARQWVVGDVARELKKLRSDLPSVRSLAHMIRSDWEAGRHCPGPRYRMLLATVYDVDEHELFGTKRETPPTKGIQSLMDWIGETNTNDDTIDQITRASLYLAEAHSQIPAKNVLPEVLSLHKQTQKLLRSGKQQLRQTRELLRIESDVLAHACLLLGDLGQDKKAVEYGAAALLCAQEADANEAIAWSVQAKTARWQHRYVESAELANRGFEVSTLTPTRVELAYREANAIALFGDSERARRALQRAQKAAESLPENDSDSSSVWSFPAERQAIFELSVAIYTGDADSALRAAAMADARWAAGHRKVAANWAQIRVGAGMAYLMKGALDGAAEQVTPILELPPELRISTITRYLDNLDRLLNQPRFASSNIASKLSQEIREFKIAAPLESE
jgi:tetratricopeptide (TPR) repeat protein